MAVVTVQNMIDRVRQRTDQVNSGFVTDSEIMNWLNVGRRKHDALLTKAFGADYSGTSSTFSATANTGSYSLSALTAGTFYKLLGLDRADTTSPTGWRDVKPYNFHDRNVPAAFPGVSVSSQSGEVRYRIYGSNLLIRPIPTGTINMQIWWLAQATAFAATSDSFDDVNGSSEFIVLDAAIAVKDKEESDTSNLQNDRAIEERRILEMAPQRDAGEPESVADVQGSQAPYPLIYPYPWR